MDVMSLSKADRDRLKQLVKVKWERIQVGYGIQWINRIFHRLVIRNDCDLLLIKCLDHALAEYHHYHYLQNSYHKVCWLVWERRGIGTNPTNINIIDSFQFGLCTWTFGTIVRGSEGTSWTRDFTCKDDQYSA